MVQMMKMMVTSFQRSRARTATLRAPTLQQAAADPHLPGDSWTLPGESGPVSCGVPAPFSWVLVHKVCLCPPESVSQSWVSSHGSMVGLMATSFQRAYATPRSVAPRAPAPAAGHCWPVPPQETLKHSSLSVSVGVSGSSWAQGLFGPLSVSGGDGV